MPENSRSGFAPARNSFALTGPSIRLDPRCCAIRADLADVRLAEHIFAPRYAAPIPRTATARVPIRSQPQDGLEPLSEILIGETFDLIDITGQWAWGTCRADGSVGYVPADALGRFAPAPETLPARSIQASASRLVGTPYLSGGRSVLGLDAGGFVFLSVTRAGYDTPRFTDLQSAGLGRALVGDANLAPGDLLFGHDGVGIVLDKKALAVLGPAVGEVQRHAIDGPTMMEMLGANVMRRRLV